MSVGAVDERLSRHDGTTASRVPEASGQAHLTGPHAWLRAMHPGFAAAAATTQEREVGKEDSGVQHPHPSLALSSCFLSKALITRLARLRAGVLQPALPVVPVSFCLHLGPNHNL